MRNIFWMIALCGSWCGFAAAPLEAAFARLVLPVGNRIVYDHALKAVCVADRAADAAWLAAARAGTLKTRQADVRAKLLAAIGGLPARCPLNVVETGRVQRDGYSVVNLYFESQPRHYVTANLFLPDPNVFPGCRPGIVVPCGHSMNGKASVGYQRGAVQAAKAGFVTLVYDPIDQGERRQSRRSDTLWNCAAHNNLGRRAELLGWSAVRFRLWDGLRALDVLAARPDVDAARLGVMGHSGGGTMASWIMALDDRVACAAPSGFLSTLRAVCEQCGPQDAEQFVFGQLSFGFNHLGHVLLRAPSPVLLCASFGDFFPYSGVCGTAERAAEVYRTLGAAAAFRLSDTIGPHHWHETTRTVAVAWMNAWLQQGPPLADLPAYRNLQYGFDYAAVDCGLGFEPKNLAHMRTNHWAAVVTPTGSTLDLPGARTVYDLMKDEADRAVAARSPCTADVVRRVAGIRSAAALTPTVCHMTDEQGVRTQTLVQDDGTPIPLVTVGAGTPVLIVSDAPARKSLAADVARRVAAGQCVTVADIRGFGENARGCHVFYGIKDGDEEMARLYALVGVSFVGKRAEDVIAAAKAASSASGGMPVQLIAHGRAAVAAAHAFFTARELFAGLQIERPPCAWRELFEDDARPCRFADIVQNAVRFYDWIDLIKE